MKEKNTQIALITGATRGIGLAVTSMLAAQGYRLLLVSRTEAALEKLKHRLEKEHAGLEVSVMAADLSTLPGIQSTVEWAEGFRPDVLVLCAGVFRPVSLLDEPVEDFLPQFYLNYYAAHVLSICAGRQMALRKRGHLFILSSTASRDPVPAGTYTVTKFSLRGLITVLREELRVNGVKVTEVIPGSTLTSSWEGTELPADHFVQPEEIASAILLCLQMSTGTNVEELIIKPQKGNVVTKT
ncbi:MAG TPA: SDR family oxidoreductase [Sphingobacteriaceae bacterium]|nr:SDR family oxidoreductase [Sphingobacteriaceae bacterium]